MFGFGRKKQTYRKPRELIVDGTRLYYLPATLRDLKIMRDAKDELEALNGITRSIACDSRGRLLHGPNDEIDLSIEQQAAIVRAAGDSAAAAMESMSNPLSVTR